MQDKKKKFIKILVLNGNFKNSFNGFIIVNYLLKDDI